ncbi:MAG: hypothetical protein ACFFG0_10470 [Candidatus Thorarchaeota archaeon]
MSHNDGKMSVSEAKKLWNNIFNQAEIWRKEVDKLLKELTTAKMDGWDESAKNNRETIISLLKTSMAVNHPLYQDLISLYNITEKELK